MQRATTDPSGRQWIVHIQWMGRRIGRETLLARFAHRRSARRARKASDAAMLRGGTRPPKRDNKWHDALDPGCLDLGEFPAVLVVIAVIVLLIWLGPGAARLAARSR